MQRHSLVCAPCSLHNVQASSCPPLISRTFPAGLGTWYLMLRKASVNGVNEREESGFLPPVSASASAAAAGATLSSPGVSSIEAASLGAV